MRSRLYLFLSFILLSYHYPISRDLVVDPKAFFLEEGLIEVEIVSDFKYLVKNKLEQDYKQRFQSGIITVAFPDGNIVKEQVEVRTRGEFRRERCYMPPIMINFKTSNNSSLSKLGKLKLVWPCRFDVYHEQLILKEYLVYKIYNLLTEKSFRVRLVKIKYQDTNSKKYDGPVFGFFIEDVDAMAKRNNCKEIQDQKYLTEQTDRAQLTILSIFQFMIANTDWAIPLYRNVKLIGEVAHPEIPPYAVPYDFDYCGLVNANYAEPQPGLALTSIQQRLYRGFPREMSELNTALDIFKKSKTSIDSLIDGMEYLSIYNKRETKKYINEFFEIIKSEREIKSIFITNARAN